MIFSAKKREITRLLANDKVKKICIHAAVPGCLVVLGLLVLECSDDNKFPAVVPCSVANDSSTVYIAGTEVKNDATGRSTNYAVYWKNNHKVTLTDSSVSAFGNAIAVSGDDIYVAGTVSPKAQYWKNGMQVTLSESISKASAIAISGSDIYIAGTVFESGRIKAVYWKNGNRVTLTDTIDDSEATAIAVSGNDVYVAGTHYLGGTSIAKYWKNGVTVNLTDTTGTVASASSIFVSGNDVYVAGAQLKRTKPKQPQTAIYWKNKTPVIIGKGLHDSVAQSIFVRNDKVYAVGYQTSPDISNSIALYWSEEYTLTISDNTGKYISYGSANSVFVTGAGVYIAAQLDDPGHGTTSIKYWKDGCDVILTGATSADVNSIFVVE